MRYFLNILSALIFTCTAFAGNADELFKTANNQYSKGNYKSAINLYKQLLGNANESATVYYNLANAYYKTDSIAKAILYYEKARKLNPSDENIEVNLAIANKKIEDKFEHIPDFSLISFLMDFTIIMPVDAWAIVAIALLIVSLIAFLIYFTAQNVTRKKIFFRIMFITACFFIITFIGAQLRYQLEVKQLYAIVITESIDAESSPDEQGKRLYVLHAGTKVKLLTVIDDWAEVRLPDNNVAWVKTADIERI